MNPNPKMSAVASAISPYVRRLVIADEQRETSWLKQTQDLRRANADNVYQEKDELLTLVLTSTLLCGVALMMYALVAQSL